MSERGIVDALATLFAQDVCNLPPAPPLGVPHDREGAERDGQANNTRLVLPQMMTGLRVELYQSHWVFTAPGIARTVLTASTGWLSGWLGPRTLYLLSVGSLTLGALGSLLAWDWPSLPWVGV